MRNIVLLLIVFTVFCISFDSRSEAARPTVNVATSTIADIDPVAGTVFRIGSDGLGNYLNGVNSVVSIVQGIGNWELDANASPLRKVRVDLGDPVPGSGANAPFSAAMMPFRFISKCTTDITTLALNQSIPCPLALSMNYNGVIYALRSQTTNYPGTNDVTWKCLARNSTKCISWEMTPSAVQADGQRKNVMQLLKPAQTPKGSDVLLGRFYMSFKVNVTTP